MRPRLLLILPLIALAVGGVLAAPVRLPVQAYDDPAAIRRAIADAQKQGANALARAERLEAEAARRRK